MDQLDLRTAFFIFVAINAIQAGVMYILWRQNHRRFAELSFWLVAYAMQLLNMLLLSLRDVVPDFLSIVVGNLMGIGGMVLIFLGLERHAKKVGHPAPNILLLFVFTALHLYFTYAQPDLRARIFNLSWAALIICAQSAWLVLRQAKKDAGEYSRGIGWIFVTYCLVSLARILINAFISPGETLFRTSIYDSLMVVLYEFLFVTLSYALFLQINHRLITEMEADLQKRQQVEAALRSSETLNRSLVEHLPQRIFVKDRRSTYIFCNAVYARELNLSPDQVVGKDDFAFYPAGMAEKFRSADQFVMSSGKVLDIEEDDSTSGELRWSHTIKVPFSTGDGPVDAVLGITEDISARKKAEEETARIAMEWQTTFDVTRDAIWVLDRDHRIVRANRATEEIFHRPLAEVIGKPCWEMLHGTPDPIAECPALRARDSLRREYLELQLGSSWFEITADPFVNAAGQYGGAVHIIRDITQAKQMESNLKDKLEELNRWHQVTLGRENRVMELKQEVNALLAQAGRQPRYASVEADAPLLDRDG